MHAMPLGIPTLVMGDFNIDVSTATVSSKNLLSLMRYHGFHPTVTTPTHRKGGVLDNIFANMDTTNAHIHSVAKYYTDHTLISFAAPWHQLLSM